MIVRINKQNIAPQVDYPNPQRLVRANPQRQTWAGYDSADGLCTAGIWACESGAWRIAFAETKEEFFCIRHGRVKLTAESGHAEEFGPGDAAVIPAGFRGVFEVLEPVEKYYVIVERAQ